jgi:CheY-like chemotaxis protein
MRIAGRVLLIDDNPDYLAAVGDLLRDEGYVVDAATTTGGALDLLWRDWDQQPDVILLDLHLPRFDGRSFAELYRLLPVPHAPVVLVTGAAKADPQAIGATDVLRKPFALDDLLTCLHRVTHREPVA